jgi:SdrD B-like domain
MFDRIRNRLAAKQTTRRRPTALQARLSAECLEDRALLSTASSIVASFNGTAIPAGDTVWFSAAVTASGLSKTAPVTVHIDNGAITFTAAGTTYNVPVPNGVLVFNPVGTSAVVTFDPSDNDWDVSAPSGGTGDVFATGVALPVPNGLPGGIKNVTWSADFWSDTAGVTVNWKWAAAAYKPGFGSDYNALNVKPVDNNSLSAYHNGDQSGTPEAFKTFLAAGATGGGGTNYTGNFTPAKSVKPTLGDGVQDYPYPSSNPLTSIAFNESTVLKAANLDTTNGFFELWYSDEHALALGVRQVNVVTAGGTTTTNYPVTPLTSNPGTATNPLLGTTATTGDQAGTDLSGRPISPMLYITDTTNNPNDRSGDWQWGGTGITPNAVFGTWKGVVRTVNYTTATPTVTVVCDADPAKNGWNLGAGSDAPPTGTANEGYGAEVRWNLADLYAAGVLVPGHTYRFYVMVHDGDQNKSGGDSGQASFTFTVPGQATQPASVSGHVTYADGLGTPAVGETLALLNQFGAPILDGNGVPITTTTDANGYYQFTNLPAGNYVIAEVTTTNNITSSAGTVNGTTDGTANSAEIDSILLNPGDVGINYDFVIHFVE